MPRINRRKSIRTPPRRDRISPSKRDPMPEAGPTDFLLQRKAEQIGLGTVCDVETKRVQILGGAPNQARVEFATSSVLALLREHNKILHRHYQAGTEYGRLHRTLFGRSTPKPSSLGRMIYTDLNERLDAERKQTREEMDDDAYIEWMQEQRVLYERGEYRLRHIAGCSITERRLIRIVLRHVILDNAYPRATQIGRVRIGLNELADVWTYE
jgi:hypothetical protein